MDNSSNQLVDVQSIITFVMQCHGCDKAQTLSLAQDTHKKHCNKQQQHHNMMKLCLKHCCFVISLQCKRFAAEYPGSGQDSQYCW